LVAARAIHGTAARVSRLVRFRRAAQVCHTWLKAEQFNNVAVGDW
jgi:hypothetical protein